MIDPITRLNAALEGRYRIECELGQGGMATVYLADDLKHARKVALKVLKPELAAVVGAERFLAEIRTTANLQHPHILPLFDSGEADGFLFYVMPLVEGETLRERLTREHQLPVDDALRVASAVLSALDYAHRHGVIHRDIKPANILLHDGEPVVSDFGIALAVDAGGGDRLTETGLSMGTPHYMSPEQAAGDGGVGPASDVYALGCVLYEMLVGEPPYTGRTAQAVLANIITAEPDSVLNHRKAVPANVDSAVARALEKLPADRFGRAQDFATALAQSDFRHGTPQWAGRVTAGRYLAAALLGALVATLAVGGLVLTRASAPLVRFGTVTKVTFDEGLELAPAISPDGQELAYVSTSAATGSASIEEQGNRGAIALSARVVVRGISGGNTSRVSTEPHGFEESPSWSPDGSSLAFHAEGQVFQVPARGGTPRPMVQVAGDEAALYGAWSPDGEQIAYVKTQDGVQRLFIRSLQGEERKVADSDGDAHALRWSPDGRLIAFVEGNSLGFGFGPFFGNVAPSQIWIARVEGGDPVPVTGPEYVDASPSWLPDGRLLFVSSRGGGRDVYLSELERDGSVRGEPVRITAGLNPHTISTSADGRRIAYSVLKREQNIHVMAIPEEGPVSGYAGVPVTVGQQVVEGMAVSPEGEWIAFDSDRSGNQDVYRRRLAGGEALQLDASPSDEFVRSWSADRRWIVGHGFNQENRDIYLMDADGLGITYPFPHPAQERYPDLSPDGMRIVFQSTRAELGGDGAVYLAERDASGSWSVGQQISRGVGARARWSPDGTRVVYITPSGVWLTPGDSGEARMIFEEPDRERGAQLEAAEWYAGGSRLLVMRRFPDATAGLWSITPTGDDLRELIRYEDPGRQPRPEMAVHADRVYFTIGEFESDVWVMDVEWQ